jgi:predicted O-methyltransferase YrrM
MINKIKHSIKNKVFAWRILSNFPMLKKAFSITSHLTLKERFTLFQLADNKERILEIGSYIGASAACFGASKANNSSCEIYCIDTWNNDAMTEGKKETYHLFTQNTSSFKNLIVPIRGFSSEVVEQVKQFTEHLDLLFIDGDHAYDGVKSDWENYKGFLREGSIVVFHDYGWAEGVKRIVNEDVLHSVSDYHSLPNMWWGTIKSRL